MDMPWKNIAPIDSSKEYLALVTYWPLKKRRTIALFLVYFRKSKAARWFRRNSWIRASGETFTEKLLDHVSVAGRKLLDGLYSSHSPFTGHGGLAPHMGPTKFTRWKVFESDLPLRWDVVMQRAKQEAQSCKKRRYAFFA